jgi:hypothetical protein
MDGSSGYSDDTIRANRIGHAASPTPAHTLSVALIDSASCSGRNSQDWGKLGPARGHVGNGCKGGGRRGVGKVCDTFHCIANTYVQN